MLSISNLNVKYGQIHALRDVGLEVAEGSVVAVLLNGQAVGRSRPNGAFYRDVPPGDYRVAVTTEATRQLTFTVAAGEERTFTSYRAYFRYVPKGRFITSYTVRLDTPGTFQLAATRVEAMYAPEMFGASPVAPWVVQP